MKKLLLMAVAFVATFQISNAQMLETGSSLINLGIGLGGNYNIYNTYSSQTPAIGLSYDYGFKEGVGPGLITIGGYLGYKSLSYENSYTDWDSYTGTYVNYNYKWTWSYFIVGARGTYQYNVSDKFDVYGGVLLSLNFVNFKNKSNDPYWNNYNYNYGGGNFGLTGFVGARYAITEKIGAFAELGYGISYLTIGAGFKL